MTSEGVGYALSLTTAICREPNKPRKVDDESLRAWNLPTSLLRVWSPLRKPSMQKLAQECSFLGPEPTAHTGLSVQHRLHQPDFLSFFFLGGPAGSPCDWNRSLPRLLRGGSVGGCVISPTTGPIVSRPVGVERKAPEAAAL